MGSACRVSAGRYSARPIFRAAARRAVESGCARGGMYSIALLLAGSLLATPPGSGRAVLLRLETGQEFIYPAAKYVQEGERPGATFTRFYDVYVLILEARPTSWRAAFPTVQRVESRPRAEA